MQRNRAPQDCMTGKGAQPGFQSLRSSAFRVQAARSGGLSAQRHHEGLARPRGELALEGKAMQGERVNLQTWRQQPGRMGSAGGSH